MVNTKDKILKAKRILNKLNILDAKFLTGQIKKVPYTTKRNLLRKQFESLKR